MLGLQWGLLSPSPVKELAEIELGEVVAWRCWQVRRGLLRSVSFDHLWSPDQPMTGDIENGYAGVYAWKDVQSARIFFEDHMSGARAWGAVELWGKIVEHERGYRAENAVVVAIVEVHGGCGGHVLGRSGERLMLRRLRARYGVAGEVEPALVRNS